MAWTLSKVPSVVFLYYLVQAMTHNERETLGVSHDTSMYST
jgi:hypothetical protein